MSTLKADAITSASSNTDIVITGAGSGVPDIEASFKVGGTAGVPMASIRTSSGTASSSTFLRGDGQWQAPSGGAWAVKASGTLSAASSLTVTGLTKTTQVWLDGIFGSDNTSLILRTSSDGGSSYDSGGTDYNRVSLYAKVGGGGASEDSETSDSEYHCIDRVGNASGESFGGYITVYNPAATHQTNLANNFGASEGTTDVYWYWTGMGQRKEAAIVDAIEIKAASGTITVNYAVLELN